VALQEFGLEEGAANYAVLLVSVLTHFQNACAANTAKAADESETSSKVLSALFEDSEVRDLLSVNLHQGKLWFNAEAWNKLTTWLFMTHAVQGLASGVPDGVERCFTTMQEWQAAAKAAGYQVEKLTEERK
jgi:hypothetical protein